MVSLTLTALLCSVFCAPITAGAAETNFVALAQMRYERALEVWRQQPSAFTAAVEVAHAATDYADIVPDDKTRAEVAQKGIDAARRAVEADRNNAAGHYWLGMNLGEFARTKTLGALGLVKEMAGEFFTARDLDEKFDHSGPNRSLGLLFRDAPGWPTSVGDKKKARQYLQNAVAVSPEFPENQLCLLESYEKWGERPRFEKQFETTERVMKEARTRFTGEEWAYSWSDWEKRFEKMKRVAAKVGRSSDPKGAR